MKQEILEEVVEGEICDAIRQELSGINTTEDGASPGGSRGALLAQPGGAYRSWQALKSQPVTQS